jgi:alginate O-acetyltransferase complex protein AlgI
MLFTTLPFAAFFLVVFAVHWCLPRPMRRVWLLVASYFFYMQALPQYGLLIGALTLINYFFGLALGKRNTEATEVYTEWHGRETKDSSSPPNSLAQLSMSTHIPTIFSVLRGPSVLSVFRPHLRHALLIMAIVANLGTLAFFKYATLLLDAVWPLAQMAHPGALEPALAIILPLGISFFTFEFIHYVVEVYRGQPPIRNPIDFALFAAFFPTQIAGPIKRFPDWVKQLRAPARLRDVAADRALSLILRGMAKKILVADLLAPVVAQAFARPDRLGFVTTWLAIYAFAAQIYADFSGYTDIGRGCAMLLGYSVPENFASPYQARNPSEFWDRWHISLSTWLRDYLYIPLGGSRRRLPRVCLNLLLTMALGGLWHGASWHFMLWGVYQGALLIAYRLWATATQGPECGMTRNDRGIARDHTIHCLCSAIASVIRKLPITPRLTVSRAKRRSSDQAVREGGLRGGTPLGAQTVSITAARMPNASARCSIPRYSAFGSLLGQLVTFHLVCLGWVLFRADTWPLAWTLITSALHPMRHNFWAGFQWFAPGALALPGVVLAGAALVVLRGWVGAWLAGISAGWRTLEKQATAWHARWEPHLRPALQLALLLLIAIWPQGAAQRFIYFQF